MVSETADELPHMHDTRQISRPFEFPLPQELVDLIVDEVAALAISPGCANPYEHISICHQVSRTFARRSRVLLFRLVKICSKPHTQLTQLVNRLAEFADLLVGTPGRPSILSSVWFVKFHCNLSVKEGLLDFYANEHWLEILRILSSEGSRLVGFGLSNKLQLDAEPSWTTFSEEITGPLKKIVAMPRLREFSLGSFSDVPWDLFNGSSIRVLGLYRVFSASEAPKNVLSICPPELEHLVIADGHNSNFPLQYALRRPSRPQQASLKVLHFSVLRAESFYRLSIIAKNAFLSLTVLDILIPTSAHIGRLPICLEWFLNLVHLSIAFPRTVIEPAMFFSLFDLRRFLSISPHDRRTTIGLKRVDLHLDFEPWFIERSPHSLTLISPEKLLSLLGDEARLGDRFRPWRNIDAMLCGPRYANLGMVFFTTRLSSTFLRPRGGPESLMIQYAAVVQTWTRAIATHAFPNLNSTPGRLRIQ